MVLEDAPDSHHPRPHSLFWTAVGSGALNSYTRERRGLNPKRLTLNPLLLQCLLGGSWVVRSRVLI